MGLGLRGTAFEACRFGGAVLLLTAPLWLPSCGSSSQSDDPPQGSAAKGGSGSSGTGGGSSALGGGGSSGSTAAAGGAGHVGGGSADGGTASGGRTGMAGAGGASGTSGANGASAGMSAGASGEGGIGGVGGSSAEGGEAALAGNAGTGGGPQPGLACSGDWCELGERCVFCNTGEGTFPRCAPDPDEDPTGYDEAMAGCLPVGATGTYSDCDGPEDCDGSEFCVVGNDGEQFGTRCMNESELPEPFPAMCCFTCSALPECVLCWSADDCPDAYECSPVQAPGGVGGCRPPV